MRAGPPPRSQQIFTLLMMVVLLVFVLVSRRQCADGTANLLRVLEVPLDAGAAFDRR